MCVISLATSSLHMSILVPVSLNMTATSVHGPELEVTLERSLIPMGSWEHPAPEAKCGYSAGLVYKLTRDFFF